MLRACKGVQPRCRLLQRQEAGRGQGPRPGFEGTRRSLLALAARLLEVVHDGGVGEGRGIAEVVLAVGHAAQDAAHDLAAPRLRQVWGEDDLLRRRVGAYGLPDLVV